MKCRAFLFLGMLIWCTGRATADEQLVQFNFVDAPLELVIEQLNQSSNVTYRLDPSIQETVNLSRASIRFGDAINLLTQQYQLVTVKQQDGGILLTRATPAGPRPANAKDQRGDADRSTAQPRVLRVYNPEHISSSELAALLDSRLGGMLGLASRVKENAGNNQLVVHATLSEHDQVDQLLRSIDKARQRVRVYSRIVIMRNDAKRELGSRLGLRVEAGYTALAGGNRGTFLPTETTNTFTNNLAVDFGDIARGGNLALGYSERNRLIELEFQALESNQLIDIVATPQVLVNSGQLAYIATGTQVPYLRKTTDNKEDVVFKDALLSLQVVPRVESPDRVNLSIRFAMDTVGSLYAGVPAIDTNRLNTQIEIAPGQTLVLGGIFSQIQTDITRKVPFLGSLPIIGAIFRYTSKGVEEAELLIFLTPELVE